MGQASDWGTGLPLKANLLGKMSRLEVHHIFPKSQLYKRKFKKPEVNALANFKEAVTVLKSYEFERFMGGTLIRREPIGVCGLITPWNWPLNQVTSKVESRMSKARWLRKGRLA